MAGQLNIKLVAGARVTALDVSRRRVVTDGGEYAYGRLVLALGADPIRLKLAGDAAEQALSVNHLTDYGRFRDALAGRKSVVILGAGLIGCEFANDMVGAGYAVRVVDPAALPMASLVPPAIGAALAERARRARRQLAFRRTAASVSIAPAAVTWSPWTTAASSAPTWCCRRSACAPA